MIILLPEAVAENDVQQLRTGSKEKGWSRIFHVAKNILIGLIGDTSRINPDDLKVWPFVRDVRRVSEPFKSASRAFHPKDSVISIGTGTSGEKLTIGGGTFHMIAGPCSVESEEQIVAIAHQVKKAGATLLRGGAYKPRSSPYSFQGLEAEGLRLLSLAKKETGLPIVTEVMDQNDLDLFDDVDIIQVARNMQTSNCFVLGQVRQPILLKRGLANTIEEWLMSAEYILANGNPNVILCERGIRTFETATRNTLDLSAVPVIKKASHLPIIVDPSHGSGVAGYVKPLALAGAAVGADGLMIEVHQDPPHALSDGSQSLTPEAFADLADAVRTVRAAVKGCL